MTYVIIAIVVPLVIAFIYKSAKTEEKNMSADEFIIRCPKSIILINYACCIFFAGFGIYTVLNPTDTEPVSTGYLLLIIALCIFILAQIFASVKIKVDSKTIQYTHFLRRKPLIINFSEIALAKYEKAGNNEVLILYNDDNEKLLRVESMMSGFTHLVKRVQLLNCEFIDKSKQPKK